MISYGDDDGDSGDDNNDKPISIVKALQISLVIRSAISSLGILKCGSVES